MTSPTSTTQPELDLNAPIYDKAFAERAFWKVFNEKSTKLFSNWPAVWRTSDDYKEEQAAIKRVAKPFFYGGITSIVIFANFRLMANPSFQRMLGRRHVRTLPKNKAKTKPSEQHQSRERNVREQREEFKSSLTLERDKRKELVRKEIDLLSGLPLDFFLSTIVGMSVTSFLFTGRANMDRNRDAFETAPLLPGKSLVAQYMCNDMLNVHNRVTTPLWKEAENDVILCSFRKFVRNCQLRDKEEQRIRKDLHLNENDEVMIPLPGIANPEPREIDKQGNRFDLPPDPFHFFNSDYKRAARAKKDE